MSERRKPGEIERASMAIIAQELAERGITLPAETEAVVKRVIHATADFDYAKSMRFTQDAVEQGVAFLRRGGMIVTDTNMACSGISRPTLEKLGGAAVCFMAEPSVAQAAQAQNTTRAAVSMEQALAEYPGAALAVGNAPTALLCIAEQIAAGARPALVIGVPVGFVNVVESKKRLLEVCERFDVPAIVSLGRKGGSTVAAAICNALLYTAADALDPKARGWQ